MYRLPPRYAGYDSLATMVLIVAPDAQVRYVNTAFESIFGVSLRTLGRLKLTDMLGDQGLLELLGSVAREEVSSAQIEDELTRPLDQADLPVHVIVTQSSLPSELIVEILPVELQVRQEREERLYELSRANKEMIRNLAHEIKNPLGGIRGAAQLLQMEMTSVDLAEYTKIIIHEADRLQNLVDRLLEPHRKAQMLELINIHEVFERVGALILAEFPQGLEIIRDYDTSIPEVKADKSQLIQVMLNIARNAAQALKGKIERGEAVMEFRSRVARQVSYFGRRQPRLVLELHIIDNGPGIPKEMQERIFYPLVSGRESGSGLGLTLAQIFVHQHNGLIECKSRPGMTNFKVSLPLITKE